MLVRICGKEMYVQHLLTGSGKQSAVFTKINVHMCQDPAITPGLCLREIII